jgi:hypothetical protein
MMCGQSYVTAERLEQWWTVITRENRRIPRSSVAFSTTNLTRIYLGQKQRPHDNRLAWAMTQQLFRPYSSDDNEVPVWHVQHTRCFATPHSSGSSDVSGHCRVAFLCSRRFDVFPVSHFHYRPVLVQKPRVSVEQQQHCVMMEILLATVMWNQISNLLSSSSLQLLLTLLQSLWPPLWSSG